MWLSAFTIGFAAGFTAHTIERKAKRSEAAVIAKHVELYTHNAIGRIALI